MTYTKELVQKDIDQHLDVTQIRKEFAEEGAPQFLFPLFLAGSWLSWKLEQDGVEEDERADLCFALGQRCFGRDALEAAAAFYERFRAGQPDKPGPELAEKINKEIFGEK